MDCASGSGRQVECDVTVDGYPAPNAVRWYIDGVHDPALDNQTIVQLTLNCQPDTQGRIFAVTARATGISGTEYYYHCYA
jgi:hypothetical protein